MFLFLIKKLYVLKFCNLLTANKDKILLVSYPCCGIGIREDVCGKPPISCKAGRLSITSPTSFYEHMNIAIEIFSTYLILEAFLTAILYKLWMVKKRLWRVLNCAYLGLTTSMILWSLWKDREMPMLSIETSWCWFHLSNKLSIIYFELSLIPLYMFETPFGFFLHNILRREYLWKVASALGFSLNLRKFLIIE